jgi:hypothetical protein
MRNAQAHARTHMHTVTHTYIHTTNTAPGHEGVALPPQAGIRVLGTGLKSFVLQVHYDNADMVTGKIDSSGFKIYYTSILRANDAGILQIGDPAVQLWNKTIPSGYSKLSLEVSAEDCTNSFTDNEVTVYGRALHMHQAGARMQTTQLRDGAAVREDYVDFYDFRQVYMYVYIYICALVYSHIYICIHVYRYTDM